MLFAFQEVTKFSPNTVAIKIAIALAVGKRAETGLRGGFAGNARKNQAGQSEIGMIE